MLKIERYKIAFGRTFVVQTRGPTTVRRLLCFWVFKEASPQDVDQSYFVPPKMEQEGRVYRYCKAGEAQREGDLETQPLNAKEVREVKSGIYSRFGTENKDVVTEATAQEFRDWLAVKGLNISFMSDGTLNGDFMGRQEPFRQWEIRLAFIMDAEAKGIVVYKEKAEWEAFKAMYQKEAERR